MIMFLDPDQNKMHLLTTRRMAWLGALLFTILFYHQGPGINILLFESVFLLWLWRVKRDHALSTTTKIYLVCHVLSMAGVFLSNNMMALIMNVLLTGLLPAVLLYPNARSITSLTIIGAYSGLRAPLKFIQTKSSRFSMLQVIMKYRFLLIPLFIVFLFLVIYANANAVFGDLFDKTFNRLFQALATLFEEIDFSIVTVTIFGLFVSVILLFHTANTKWIDRDREAMDVLSRIRKRWKHWSVPMNALKTEYRAALFLLISLNLLIALLNVIDISQIWFGFSWHGEDFADMVHEGTTLLIISILISMGIVLYYFRRNLNFYPHNQWLKYLSYIWIAQNGILLISVLLRNYHYCKVFSLAEKRIGVFIFLWVVVFGLYTVYRKVKWNLTAYYLFRVNSLCMLITLTIASLVPWDIVIARINFSRSGQAFIYLEHMSTLSDKSLPYLDKDISELLHITQKQYDQFSFREKFITPEEYVNIISQRKIEFIDRWEKQGVFSWNLAEFLAYKELKSKGL